VRNLWLACAGCANFVRLWRTRRSDAQGVRSLHEHPRRLTAAFRMPSGEIRNMHSAYGYYGLYLYLRKELHFSELLGGNLLLWSAGRMSRFVSAQLREGRVALTHRTPQCGCNAAR